MKANVAVILIVLSLAKANTHADYSIDWHVISAKGSSAGGTYSMNATIGMYDSSVTNTAGSQLENNFWSAITPLPAPQWVLRATNGPSPRYGHAMAYDSARGVTVLFGGRFISADQTRWEQLNDLWEWDGNQWIQRMTSSTNAGWRQSNQGYWYPDVGDVPVARRTHAMAYDSRRARVVLFGGEGFPPGGVQQAFLNDTWEWDGLRWELRATNGPSPRLDPCMAYDSERGVTVMAGGGGQTDSTLVWEWDGVAWKSIQTTNGPGTNYGEDAASMAYDSGAHEVLFGPTTDGFWTQYFWAWDGHAWQARASLFSPPYGAMVYDSLRRQIIYFGGQGNGPFGGNTTSYLDGAGGWWSVDSVQSSSFTTADLLDARALLAEIREQGNGNAQAVWAQFSGDIQQTLNDANVSTDQKTSALIQGLNALLRSNSFYSDALFPNLSVEESLLKALPLYGADLIRFNRLLLEQAYPAEIAKSPSVPPGRMNLAAAYDERRHVMVVAGGLYNPITGLSGLGKVNVWDTWELLAPDKLQIDEQPSSIFRKVDDLAGFHVGARAPAGTTLTYQWFFNGQPLTDDGRILGSRTDSLRIDTVKSGDAGQYFVKVWSGLQMVQSATAKLSLLPKLDIVALPADMHLIWGDPGVVLEQTDNVGGTWTPVPGATSPFRISGSGPAKYFRTRPLP